MNALRVFAAVAVAPRQAAALQAAALKILQGDVGVGHFTALDFTSLFQRSWNLHKLRSGGVAVTILLLVVLPVSLIIGLYCIVATLTRWTEESQEKNDGKIQGKDEEPTWYAPSAGNIPKPQFQRPGQSSAPASSTAPPPAQPTRTAAAPAAPALVVQSPTGVVLQFDGALAPFYEHCTVRLRSTRGANDVIRARADELSGEPRVFVESASGVPLALLDTRYAANDVTDREREVWISRIVNASWNECTPCALVKPAGRRFMHKRFLVHRDDQSSFILEVQTMPDSGYIDQILDSQGAIVVRNPSEDKSQNMIWVTQGADMALIASVVFAVQKLA